MYGLIRQTECLRPPPFAQLQPTLMSVSLPRGNTHSTTSAPNTDPTLTDEQSQCM
jgi:hypothetical protein